MTFRIIGTFLAALTAFAVCGCGATPESHSPTADEIRTSQQAAVQRTESNTQLSAQQKAMIEQHLGGVQPTDSASRSGDLHKK